jgi:hypothetical protein
MLEEDEVALALAEHYVIEASGSRQYGGPKVTDDEPTLDNPTNAARRARTSKSKQLNEERQRFALGSITPAPRRAMR